MSSFDYHFHTDLNVIEVRPAGVVEISDIVSYAEEVLSLDLINEGTIEYYDLSEMTDLNGSYKSMLGLTGLLREWVSRGWQGSVFFTPQEYQFGMIRMIGAVVDRIPSQSAVPMIPRRQPLALGEVRELIEERRRVS